MVKWKNYPEEENSWVDEPDLLVHSFHSSLLTDLGLTFAALQRI